MFKPWEKWILLFGAIIAVGDLYEVVTYDKQDIAAIIAQKLDFYIDALNDLFRWIGSYKGTAPCNSLFKT
ncbi:hypothetical protein [Sphingobium lactosutens]|uniref:Uncharacterized protein n=1 Tax=Sphingobium lactosutens DS20 TaxID=1331060 RepID=T0H7R9_9SPHN|nr:hypothetical protein [Sphingobium lactosutens]EQB12331.1 hypothetical protein RLDS_19485 [Sphingobium lactosutens DS20]